jgi:molecular chaperone GrpE (heat shock protein)
MTWLFAWTLLSLTGIMYLGARVWVDNKIERHSIRHQRAMDEAASEQHAAITRAKVESAARGRTSELDVLSDLLPIVDAVQAACVAEWDGEFGPDLLDGLQLINRELQGFLRSSGVVPIRPVAEEHFDPNVHEAINTVSTPWEAGLIAECHRDGYQVPAERLLRPATVSVSQARAS